MKQAEPTLTRASLGDGTFRALIRRLFDLRVDTDEEGTRETILSNVELKSGNAWTLVLAIFIASIGLALNSTAIIIGAMLISPLMGPILGAGLALGTNDFPLLKRSARSLLIAVGISVVTSTLFFMFSPIDEAQSELLARTKPTVYDVLIGVFGGMTGIIAVSRKEKGVAIPGVAIATALMPPLCTAGFGIANGRPSYFFGAIYLFIINSVFICLSTYIFVRYLNFYKAKEIDPKRELRLRRMTMFAALVVFVPSVFLAWTFYSEEKFKSSARKFIEKEFHYAGTFVVDKSLVYEISKQKIVMHLIGETLPPAEIDHLKDQLKGYGLTSTELLVKQSSLTEALERKLEQRLSEKSALDESTVRMRALQEEVGELKKPFELTKQLREELSTIFPGIQYFAIAHAPTAKGDAEPSSELIAVVQWKRRTSSGETARLRAFLKKRLTVEDLSVLVANLKQ
jgi:uncharacterized hydrophobic protein (TIGR00271 family)